MPEFYQLDLSEQEILMIVEQLYMNMLLDFKQHAMLSLELQAEDAVDYKERQKTRYSVLLKALDVLELPSSHFEGLEDIVDELEGNDG